MPYPKFLYRSFSFLANSSALIATTFVFYVLHSLLKAVSNVSHLATDLLFANHNHIYPIATGLAKYNLFSIFIINWDYSQIHASQGNLKSITNTPEDIIWPILLVANVRLRKCALGGKEQQQEENLCHTTDITPIGGLC